MSYFQLCLPNHIKNTQGIEYHNAIGDFLPELKKNQVLGLLQKIFTNTVTSLETVETNDVLQVKITHTPITREISSERTSLYVPKEVHFTITKKGSLLFKEPQFAPYERLHRVYPEVYYYVWDGVDVIEDKYYIGSSSSYGFFFSMAKLDRVVREIKIGDL